MFTTLTRALAAGALLAGAVNAGDHFIITQTRTLSLTRIDPLMNPGGIGPHAHVVLGASNFSPYSGSPDVLSQAKCTSTMVQADKSSYWAPQVYYNHGNGSYSAIITSTRIYYFLKALNGTTPVVPFPRGHRMLAGGPSDSRPATYPPRGELSYDQQQAMDPRINAIKWGCSAGAVQGQGSGGSLPGQRPYLPNDAPNGCGVLNAGIFFPSCSDGRLDSDDHFSHMRYPLDGPNGYNCPPSHSIKYPTIFMENFYFMGDHQPYRGPNQDNWVLSNGDTLGLTFHSDFINGWDQDVLTRTLQQCNAPNAPEANLEQCGPLAESLSVESADNCRSEGVIADEQVGLVAPIDALPGCNPIWPVEARTKPTCKTDGEVAAVEPSGRYTNPDFKISLPLAGGSKSKVVAAPSGADPSASYSSYDYNYGSSTYATSSAYGATSTSAPEAAATTSTSEAAAAATESSTSASASTTAAYYDPGYYGSSPSSTPAASPSESATTTYAAAASDPTSNASSESSTSTSSYAGADPSSDPAAKPSSSNPGADPSSSYPESQPTSTSPASAPTADPATATADPATAPADPASVPAGAASTAPQLSSTVSTSAAPTSTPQKANVVGGGPGNGKPKKTCSRKKGKGKKKTHARRHREWQSRIIH